MRSFPQNVRTYVVPGLATVTVNPVRDADPAVKIVLDPSYSGDLNDVPDPSDRADGVYLAVSSPSAINNGRLKRFVEVLAHWDYDHDGTFDADHVVAAIEQALYMSTEIPDKFHRPQGGLFVSMLMKIMPPAPKRHFVLGFGNLKPRYRWFHYALALPFLATFIALVLTQIHFIPVMKYSVISGFIAVTAWLHLPIWLGLVLLVVAIAIISGVRESKRRGSKTSASSLMSTSPYTIGFFNKAAVSEEQAFREGSENWTPWQRVVSCFAFGALHMINLWYPLASILPLALGGGLFMFVYLRTYRRTKFRRSAVLAAAVMHRVYNRIALFGTAIALLLIATGLVIQLVGIVFVGAVVAYEATNAILDRRAARGSQTSLEPAPAE
ncbi:MAG TPA: CPBP family intramembrane glutamic endopeptidase [Candidatus Saccharimonadales bacterium]|nr:CPBP family intramembrane glutamic endopeptidase [Candidatus Saccharimonadales bacterium]